MTEAKYQIPLIEPYLGKQSRTYVNECFDTKWISSRGHFIGDFEKAFASFVGTKYAVAVSNGTTALHLALIGFGIGEGDEVIVPDLTFAATINSVLHAKAKPVLVDIDPVTWNIDPKAFQQAITSKTKAVIPVHLYGYPAAMDEIKEITSKHSICIVEDSAEAHGAKYNNVKAGALGDCSAFSFYGNKIITTGEGGMITLNDEKIYNRITVLRDHGMNKKDRYKYDEVGYNYRMTNPQGALGVAQLLEIEEILSYRKKIQQWYEERLNSVRGVVLRRDHPGVESVNWLFTCLVDRRDDVIKKLEEAKIESRPMFFPLHEMPIYKNYLHGTYHNSQKISYRGISLPTYYGMPESFVDRVCTVIKQSVES
ncbi:MAG: DegT/DnrJ/EryC1/StrS family aminotransferase [Bacteroidota bacterium]